MSSGYSVPHPVRFSMTVTPTRSPLMKRPLASFPGLPRAIHLGLVLHQCEYRAAWDGLALANRLHGLGGAVQLAVLLVVVTIDRRIEHVILVVRRKRDLLGTGASGHRGQGQGERNQHERDRPASCHSASSEMVVTSATSASRESDVCF